MEKWEGCSTRAVSQISTLGFQISNLKARLIIATAALVAMAPVLFAQDAKIEINADQSGPALTRYMTGACIEDVNHEIYGGIYSQMIFGESFQEPAPPAPIRDFKSYGGDWLLKDGVVSVGASDGPKLVSDHAPLATGEVRVEVFLPGKSDGVAGLIVKVAKPGPGTDAFTGYEIALNSARQVIVLGRHRQNWEPIREVPCDITVDTWIPLSVRMGEGQIDVQVDDKNRGTLPVTTLEVLVNGKSVTKYQDNEHPLLAGAIGLRPFNRAARYRNLSVKTDGQTEPLPFVATQAWTDGVSGMWRPVRRGSAEGRFTLSTEKPFVGSQSQEIVFTSGEGGIGIENKGLNRWGLSFVDGRPYEGFVNLKVTGQPKIEVLLESRDGSKVYARTQLELRSESSYQKSRFVLTPNATDKAGRFTIVLKEPGDVLLGYVLLQPGEWGRFKGLPCRKDVVDGLIEQGLTVLRYGGSMVNAPEYRWKKMLGPRHFRPPYKGTWYPYSTNGWGIIDFLDLCEAAGFLAIPAFNMDETPQDMADFIDYVNGTGRSDMADLRLGVGHPKPYNLKHIQLGNEEAVDESYWKRFKPLAETIWAKDKDITIVVGDFAFNEPIIDPYNFKGGAVIKTLAAHKKILDLAVEHDREIWFDVHVWNHEPRDCEGLGGVPTFIEHLAKFNPKAKFKVAVFELNANNHEVRRALGNAHAINELERLGDRVPVVCSANCLQCDGQNDNGWNQGLLFLNPWMVWPQPPYFVTQMLSRNYLPACVQAKAESPGNALDVTAKRSADGKVLQLQVVNLDAKPLKTTIAIAGFKPTRPAAQVSTLTGQLADRNTAAEPARIVPKTQEWQHGFKDGRGEYEFPAYSFTLLRWE